jgi:hypothetical protein
MPPPGEQLSLDLPAPPVVGEVPPVPARMVNEYAYCPRLAYLMWTQAEWTDSGDTVEDGIVTPVDYKRGKRPHVAQGV